MRFYKVERDKDTTQFITIIIAAPFMQAVIDPLMMAVGATDYRPEWVELRGVESAVVYYKDARGDDTWLRVTQVEVKFK